MIFEVGVGRQDTGAAGLDVMPLVINAEPPPVAVEVKTPHAEARVLFNADVAMRIDPRMTNNWECGEVNAVAPRGHLHVGYLPLMVNKNNCKAAVCWE